MTDGRVREKMLSNLAEAKAREAPIVAGRQSRRRRGRRARRSRLLGAARRRAALADRQRRPAAAAGLSHRRHRRQRRRPAAQPRQDRHGRVMQAPALSCAKTDGGPTNCGRLSIEPNFLRIRRGQRADQRRADARDLRGDARRSRAALDARPRHRVDHRRVRDAAARDARAHAARKPQRQARRPHARDPALDRARACAPSPTCARSANARS